MRTDNELRTDVLAELNWDPSIRHEDIATAVKDGVITLAGTVDTYAQRYAAERAAERVHGVRGIVNDVTVKAHAALDALRWNIQVPDERVTVRVADGWVTLDGQVDQWFQKQAAERAVRFLTGVRGVTNQIALRPLPTPTDIKQRIRASLKRQAELDADLISVEVSGSRITLGGSVRSLAERREAERAAWNAPGVTRVDSELKIYPFVTEVA